jgi:hypothetical protein
MYAIEEAMGARKIVSQGASQDAAKAFLWNTGKAIRRQSNLATATALA